MKSDCKILLVSLARSKLIEHCSRFLSPARIKGTDQGPKIMIPWRGSRRKGGKSLSRNCWATFLRYTGEKTRNTLCWLGIFTLSLGESLERSQPVTRFLFSSREPRSMPRECDLVNLPCKLRATRGSPTFVPHEDLPSISRRWRKRKIDGSLRDWLDQWTD